MWKTAFLLVLLLTGKLPAEDKIRVSSFSTVLSEIAEKVGGERVAVSWHVKPGVDPHEYEPRPDDLKTVGRAQIILLSAKHLEGYVGKLKQSTGTGALVLEVGNGFESLAMKDEDGHDHGGEDPHWWHSLKCMEKATRIVRDALVAVSAADKPLFSKNAEDYLTGLEKLGKWTRLELAKLPRDQRKLVTSHDAFQYFARENGFTVYPIEGIASSDQPSSKKVAGIVKLIREQRVKAIFPESIENPKVLSEITRESGAKLGGALYADGLGEGAASTYAGMYRANVEAIVNALK